jgi:hypothetical protein
MELNFEKLGQGPVPVEKLRNIPDKKIEEMGFQMSQIIAVQLYGACKTSEDIQNVNKFLMAYFGEGAVKVIVTKIVNGPMSSGKPLEVCKELGKTYAADFGVRISEGISDQLTEYKNGGGLEMKVKVKGQKPEDKL